MKTYALLMAVLFFSASVFADDVYMKTGSVLRNVRYIGIIKNFPEDYCHFKGVDRVRRIPLSNIIEIDSSVGFDPDGKSYMEQMPDSMLSRYGIVANKSTPYLPIYYERISRDDSTGRVELVKNLTAPKKEYPNLIWFSVSALSLVTAWEYFSAASYYQNLIESNDKLNDYYKKYNVALSIDNAPYESAKTRATVIGIACTVSTVLTTIHALKSVDIKTDGKSISMQYTF